MSYQKLQVTNAKAVVPGNTKINGSVGVVLYVGTGGTLNVEMLSGDLVTFSNVQDGSFLPIQVSKVLSTSTASNIVALW